MDQSTCRDPNGHDHTGFRPDDHEYTPTELNGRGRSLQRRFIKTGNLADISAAIAYHRKALQLLRDEDINMPMFLDDLGYASTVRFRYFDNDLSNISEAVALHKKAVQLTPEGHEEMPLRLNNFGVSLAARFWRSGDLSDISEAITNQEQALRLIPAIHKNMPTYLCDLGNSLRHRYMRLDDVSDMFRAIGYQSEAVAIAEDDNPDLPRLLHCLAISFRWRWYISVDPLDLGEAITYGNKAMDIFSDGHAELPFCLYEIGQCMKERGELTGNLSDFCDAILHYHKAILLAPNGHAGKIKALKGAGLGYWQRCKRTGDLSDMSTAITYLRKVVQLYPQDHPMLCFSLSNLGSALQDRFRRLGNKSDLDEAITDQEKAVNMAPQDNLDSPHFSNRLAASLGLRFKESKDISDIERAISYLRKTLQLCPDTQRDKYTHSHDLGRALQHRFEHTENLTDLSDSIMYQQLAVLLAPDDREKVTMSDHLAEAYKLRYDYTENPTDLNSAIANYRAAANFPGPPLGRFQAAEKWARLSRKVDPTQSLEAFGIAIKFMPHIAGIDQTIQKRHSNLVEISNSTTSAAAAALEFGRPGLALEWLEQGRCLVWSQLNNLRTSLLIDTLQDTEPGLANQMVRLSTALEQAGSRTELEALGEAPTLEQRMSIEEETSFYTKLAQEWDQLLAKVHELQQFKDFLRPLSYLTLLKGLPKFGTVVVINVQRDRCDAISLNSGSEKPLHIPLDKFSYNMAESLHNGIQAHLRLCGVRVREAGNDSTGRGMRCKGHIGIKDVLHQLWEFVVEPILIALGVKEPPPELTRIWWCVTGPLAFLPIHAAGIYDGPTASSIADFAISSYTPTVRALIERVKAPRINMPQPGLFMISQPNTPGMTRIPETLNEVRAIEKVLADHHLRVMCLNGESATVSEGMSNMEKYSCVHFACHAVQEIQYPLRSAFFLHDGRMELGSIIQKRLVGADLAFLSACQTSAGNEKLSEEAVHLAAGMMAAGYRGVVATMWSIVDQYGPVVAEEFYKNLVNAGGGLDGRHAARALHYAIQKLRNEIGDSESSLLIWVPYVHFGL